MVANPQYQPSTAHVDAAALPVIQSATMAVSQFFDLGYAIDLAHAERCLSAPTSRRRIPPHVRQSVSIQIAQPPLRVDLGAVPLTLDGRTFEAELGASIYDLGAVALRLTLPLSGPVGWETVADLFARVQELPESLQERFTAALDELESIILPAIERPARAPLVEDYCVLYIDRLIPAEAAALGQHPLVRAAVLGERRPMSPHASALVTDLSYYMEDLALLSWNGALVIEPDRAAAETVADLLEFTNVELLLLRSYEATLDAELSDLHDSIARARGRLYLPLVGRYNALLQEVQRLVIEITEVTERIDNAFKVTDDVYWNRLYSAALTSLRVAVWREGVEHRLRLVRESYEILHSRADSDRSASLEWIIILLIFIEIVMGLAGIW